MAEFIMEPSGSFENVTSVLISFLLIEIDN